jgi:DNA-binding NarL/FixJ family response regulator
MSSHLQSRTKVLVVDDHPIVRRGLSKLLGERPGIAVTGEADGAAQALEQIARNRPDLVIIDISLKDVGGLELIKQIRALDKTIKLLVCSMHDESLYAERVLQAGALGYVSKETATERIFEAIEQVMAGRVYLSPEMSEKLLGRMVGGVSVTDKTSMETLSDRELEVFELIGRGLTTRQIADRLCLSVKTIETYRENLKIKLSLSNSPMLIRAAVQWLETR